MNGLNIFARNLVISFLVFISNPAFAYFQSGSELYSGATAYVENKSSFKADYYMGYVAATMDAIGDSGVNYLNIPGNVSLDQACHIVKKYLDDHPDEWNQPATVIIFKSMVKAFPESVINKQTKK